jgi:hypothetical protein
MRRCPDRDRGVTRVQEREIMTDNASAPRSRRALLAAAAGGAAALAASAALPLTTLAADGDPVLLGDSLNNTATQTTSITDSTLGSNAFAVSAAGTGVGLLGSSTGGAGIVGWSISSSPYFDPAADGPYTGIYGWAPAGPDGGPYGAGVYGDSDDYGVVGTGGVGVYGIGAFGVIGEAQGTGGASVLAYRSDTTDLALQVVGKVKFSRSGRSNVSAGQSSRLIYLAGVTSSSKIFALLHSNRSGRYVRAVVPATGRFRIYLNSTVSSTTSVAWFVVD